MLLNALQKSGAFRAAAWFLHTSLSRGMIAPYIRNNQIDMTPFKGQRYASFADFFARKAELSRYVIDPDVLISPCDGLLSIYPVRDDMSLPMKGSRYRLTDLLPDPDKAELFRGGLCLVFRLQASDYHHFCSFDDMMVTETHYIPGLLHSVQPIACETFPVYRLNRRWWSVMHTTHFGTAAQVEVGAMVVGGVTFAQASGWLDKGSEMGNFELAGSTIVVLLEEPVRKQLAFYPAFENATGGHTEVKVTMGEGIGRLQKEETISPHPMDHADNQQDEERVTP